MLNKCIIAFLFIVFLAGSSHAEIKANNHPLELGSAYFFDSGNDGLYLGYYAKSDDNVLYVKRLDKDIDKETAITFENMKGQFVELSFLKGSTLLTWRAKKGDGKKYVYVQRSDDGGRTFKEPVVVNSANDALLPLTTATDQKEKFYVVWVDERDAKHKFYMNYSLDGGKSFLKEDILLTDGFISGNLPNLLVKDERVDFFFLGSREGTKSGIYHKYSLDSGRTWSEAIAVEPELDWGPFKMTPVRSGDTLFVTWAGVEGLHGAYSRDGKTWNRIFFRETEGKDVNRFGVQVHGSNIYIVASWQTRLARDEKSIVYFYRSSDGGNTWTGAQKLNTNEFNSTSSVFPALGVSSDGKTLLAAWQDHRNIRGGIYINYSRDGGKTWLKEDIAFEKEPGKYNSAYPYIALLNNRFYLLRIGLTDDTVSNANLYMEEVVIK